MSTLISSVTSGARTRVPRIAEAAVERARLTVVPPRRQLGRTQAARTPFAVLVLAILVGGVVGLLTFNTNMQQSSFRATALQEQVNVLTAREQALDMELDALRDPQRLAGAAKELGMVAPPQPAFLRLADGRVLGNPTPATSGDAVRHQPAAGGEARLAATQRIIVRVPAPGEPPPRQPLQTVGRGPAPATPTDPPPPEQPVDTHPAPPAGQTSPGLGQRPARRPVRRTGSLRGTSHVRLRVGFLVIAMLLSVFAARLFQLQGVDAQAYATRAESAGLVTIDLPAERGRILDRNGVPLAESVAGVMIVADPTRTTADAEAIAKILAARLELDYFDVLGKLTKRRRADPLRLHRPADPLDAWPRA